MRALKAVLSALYFICAAATAAAAMAPPLAIPDPAASVRTPRAAPAPRPLAMCGDQSPLIYNRSNLRCGAAVSSQGCAKVAPGPAVFFVEEQATGFANAPNLDFLLPRATRWWELLSGHPYAGARASAFLRLFFFSAAGFAQAVWFALMGIPDNRSTGAFSFGSVFGGLFLATTWTAIPRLFAVLAWRVRGKTGKCKIGRGAGSGQICGCVFFFFFFF
jgi:hypothetical protein